MLPEFGSDGGVGLAIKMFFNRKHDVKALLDIVVTPDGIIILSMLAQLWKTSAPIADNVYGRVTLFKLSQCLNAWLSIDTIPSGILTLFKPTHP